MLNSVVLSKNGAEAHDDGSQSRLDVLISIRDEFLNARENLVHDQAFAA